MLEVRSEEIHCKYKAMFSNLPYPCYLDLPLLASCICLSVGSKLRQGKWVLFTGSLELNLLFLLYEQLS